MSVTLIAIGIAAVVVAAAGAGYSAYAANQAQQQQASAAKKSMQMQAEAENNAAISRANQIQYNADKLRRSFLSREASAGVVVGEGSLLETEGQFAFDTEYSKQLARLPHEYAGAADQYKADLFGFSKSQAAANAFSSTAVAGVGAGAAAGARMYSSLAAGPATTPQPASYE